MKRILVASLLAIVTMPAYGSWTRVQRVNFTNDSQSSFNTTISSTGSGDLIVIELGDFHAAGCTSDLSSAPTDNKSGGSSTYHLDYGPVDPATTEVCLSVYSTPNCASGITQITMASAGRLAGFIEEWKTALSTSPFDKGQNATGSSASWSSTATATLTGSTDLAIGLMYDTDNTTDTNAPTNGFGDGSSQTDATCGCIFFTQNKALSATTGIAATGTITGSTPTYTAAVVTYQAGSGGGSVVRHRAAVVDQ